jgi:hypothetical protein
MTKTESDYFFSLHQNQNICSATLEIRIFFRKKTIALPPPWKLNGPSLIEDLPRMLPTKFRLIWQNGFRGDLLEITQSETRIACGGHDCQRIGTK